MVESSKNGKPMNVGTRRVQVGLEFEFWAIWPELHIERGFGEACIALYHFCVFYVFGTGAHSSISTSFLSKEELVRRRQNGTNQERKHTPVSKSHTAYTFHKIVF